MRDAVASYTSAELWLEARSDAMAGSMTKAEALLAFANIDTIGMMAGRVADKVRPW